MQDSKKQIMEYLDMFLRRKWLIIIPAIVFTAAAALLSLNMQKYYRSSTLILVEHQQVPESYVSSMDKTPMRQRLSTIKQQILSRTRLEQVIEDFGLYKDAAEDKSGGMLASITSRVGLDMNEKPSSQELVEMMRRDIDVDVVGGKDAFRISYVGTDPYVTMEVTNTLASLFIEENLKIREQYVEGTTDFLSAELEKAKAALERQEAALREFKENHMGTLPEQLQTNLRTLDRLQLELESVRASIKNAEDMEMMLKDQFTRLASGARSVTTSGSGATTITYSSPLEEELDRMKSELASLRSVYKETYPDVIILKKRVTEIESMLADSRKEAAAETVETGAGNVEERPDVMDSDVYANLRSVRAKLESLREREAKVSGQIAEFERRVEATPANEQQMIDIQRDYNISLQNYQRLLEKKLSARLAENLEKKQKGERFRVIDPANLPEKPFKPNKVRITILGGVLGTGLGGGLVFALEFMTPVYRKPEELSDALGYPVLGSIPALPKKPRARA